MKRIFSRFSRSAVDVLISLWKLCGFLFSVYFNLIYLNCLTFSAFFQGHNIDVIYIYAAQNKDVRKSRGSKNNERRTESLRTKPSTSASGGQDQRRWVRSTWYGLARGRRKKNYTQFCKFAFYLEKSESKTFLTMLMHQMVDPAPKYQNELLNNSIR